MGHKLQSSVLTSSLYYEKPNMPMIDPDEQLRCYIIDLSQYCEVPNMPMIYPDELKHWSHEAKSSDQDYPRIADKFFDRDIGRSR